jgi:hypothetical protein
MLSGFRFLALVYGAIFLGYASHLHAQECEVRFQVSDSETGELMPFVNILLVSSNQQIATAQTDLYGYASIGPIEPGKYGVKAVFMGYVTRDTVIHVLATGQVIKLLMTTDATVAGMPEIVVYQDPLLNLSGGANGTTVTRELPDSLCSLIITIHGPDQQLLDARVALSLYDRVVAEQWTGPNGIAEFRNLSPSVYRIHVYRDQFAAVDTMVFVDQAGIEMEVIMGDLPANVPAVPGLISGLSDPFGYASAVISGYGMAAFLSMIPPEFSGYFLGGPVYSTLIVSSAPMPGPHCIYQYDEPWDFLKQAHHPHVELKLVERNGLKGIADAGGEIILQPVYRSIRRLYGIDFDRFIVQGDSLFGLVNGIGEWLLPLEFDAIFSCAERLSCIHSRNLLVVQKKGKYGLYTTNGDIIVSPQYDFLDTRLNEFTCPAEHRLITVSKNGKYGCINQVGVEVIPVVYDSVSRFEQHQYVSLYKNGKQGAATPDGDIICEPLYDRVAFPSYYGEIKVELNGKNGWINKKGNSVFPLAYDDLQFGGFVYLPDGVGGFETKPLCFVKSGEKWGISSYDSAEVTVQMVCQFDQLLYMDNRNDVVKFRVGSKWGLVKYTGEIIVPAKYDEIESIDDFEYKYRIGSKWGFISDHGTKMSPAVYDEIVSYWSSHTFYNVKKGAIYGICKSDGTEIIKPRFHKEVDVSEMMAYGYSNFESGGRYGVIDSTGKIICQAIYNDYIDVEDLRVRGYAYAYRGTYSVVVNRKGIELIGPYYDDFHIDNSGRYFFVEKDEKVGVVSVYGKKLISPAYDDIKELVTIWQRDAILYFFKVEVDGRFGLVDTLGKMVIPIEYDDIQPGIEGTFKVSRDGFANVYDLAGKCLFPQWYTSVSSFNRSCAVVLGNNQKFGMVNSDGDTIAPFKYTHISAVPGSAHYMAYSNGKEGLLDSTGRECVPPVYDNLKFYDDDFIAVKKDGLYGFMDGNYQLTVAYQYEKVKDANKGFVVIRKDGYYGVVDRKGKEVIPPILDNEIDMERLMQSGIQAVLSQSLHGVIDSSMKFIAKPIYQEYVRILADNKMLVRSNGLYGILDREGNEIIPCKYQGIHIAYFSETGLFCVTARGKNGMVDTADRHVIPLEYDEISRFSFSGEGSGCFVVKKDEMYALVHFDGRFISEFIYTAWGKGLNGGDVVYRGEKVFMILPDGTEVPMGR